MTPDPADELEALSDKWLLDYPLHDTLAAAARELRALRADRQLLLDYTIRLSGPGKFIIHSVYSKDAPFATREAAEQRFLEWLRNGGGR